MKLKALLFDKDGTLFDFSASWDAWALDAISGLAQGDPDKITALADAADYDLERRKFRPTSPIIAGTAIEAAEVIASALPDMRLDEVDAYLSEKALEVQLSEVLPLRDYFLALKSKGIAVGVMTNDSEAAARSHLSRANALDVLDVVLGYDSGFGGKPSPKPLLAFSSQMGIDPSLVAMVGDSTHDLVAGKNAGMKTIGVLTGMAMRADLEPYADIVLNDISEIPGLLEF